MRPQTTGVTVADVDRMTAKLYVTGGEDRRPHLSLGALLLFGTNVAAIIATGTGVLLLFRIRRSTGARAGVSVASPDAPSS